MPVSPRFFTPTSNDAMECDEPMYLIVTTRGNDGRPRVTMATPDTARTALLAYAAFMLDQQARYCQQ